MAAGEDVQALPTDIGRKNLAEALIFGRAIIINKFSVGSGGHDPLDNTLALTPDATLTSLPNLTFGPVATESSQLINIFDLEFTVQLAKDQAIGELSNLGLYGTVLSTNTEGDEGVVGTEFLYAVANFPFKFKSRDEFTFRVTVNF